MAIWACFGGYRCSDKKTTMAAFPESLATARTDISREFTLSRMTAVGTFEFIFFFFHFLFLSNKNFDPKISNTSSVVNNA
jgi:hypothetical protein